MLSRRHFLVSSAGLATFGAGLVTHSALLAQDTSVPTRRPLHEMDLDDPDLVTFRRFVGMLRQRDGVRGQVGWDTFARIHEAFCPHGNWYFLPWHRAYLRMYEHAAREATGNASFAMPYWDWTLSPNFPRAFADQSFDGRANPLYLNGRSVSSQHRMPPQMVGEQVIASALREQSFERFASFRPRGQRDLNPNWVRQPSDQATLEFTPHNGVHMTIGGQMPTMLSPRDPIFLMHHGNVDRLWAVWNAQGRLNTRNRLWTDMVFNNNFMVLDRRVYSERVGDLQVPETIGYSFGLPAPSADMGFDEAREDLLAALVAPDGEAQSTPGLFRLAAKPEIAATPDRPQSIAFTLNEQALGAMLSGSKVTSEALSLDSGSGEGSQNLSGLFESEGSTGTVSGDGIDWGKVDGETNVNELLGGGSAGGGEASVPGLSSRQEVFAILRDMATSAPESTLLRIFVNKPDATGATSVDDPHFAGEAAFFGGVGGADCLPGDVAPSLALNLTPTLERLQARGEMLQGGLSIQLVPVGQPTAASGSAGTVCPTTVELVVA